MRSGLQLDQIAYLIAVTLQNRTQIMYSYSYSYSYSYPTETGLAQYPRIIAHLHRLITTELASTENQAR